MNFGIRPILDVLARAVRRFRRDTRGNVAVVFGVASTVLVVATGAGMDLSRAYFARQRLSQVATLTCQYATRPSVTNNTGATVLYQSAVNTFATNQLTAQNWSATSLPTGGPSGTSSTYFTATGAQSGSSSQQPSGVAELWYNVPTTFMKIVNINQITVHAVMDCQTPPLASQNPNQQAGTVVVSEGFETTRSSYFFTSPAGQTGALSSPQNTFPTTAGYQGDSGNQFYVMGYCLEIDQVGVINSTTPQGTHSAELDCDNGSGSAGNSSISTKTYLQTGAYELRYNYRSRVDYPNYDPLYICGSTGPTALTSTIPVTATPASTDLSWANDTDGSQFGMRTNQINVYLDAPQGTGNTPPLHTTLDQSQGTQQLAGSNLIDMCIYSPNWIARSVQINVTTAGYYWLTFAADGHNDSYGGQIDNIRLCVTQCAFNAADTYFPYPWAANTVLFEDTFSSPTYSASPYAQVQANNLSNQGNLANTLNTMAGWPSQAATGWAVAPYNQINYYTTGGSGSGTGQYISLDGNNYNNSSVTTTNRLISRPFLLDPGYYSVSYYYNSNINFSALSTTYCTGAPGSGVVYAAPGGNYTGQVHYANNNGTISTGITSNIEGVFMSHGELVSTPNVANAPWSVSSDQTYSAPGLNQPTYYTNPDGSQAVPSSPAFPPDNVNYSNYNASANNPLLDTCGFVPAFAWTPVRTTSIQITKVGIYWLTLSSNGSAADGFGAGIDDVKLTALGPPNMRNPPTSNPPTSSLVAIPTPAPAAGSSINFGGFSIIADPFIPSAAPSQ